MHRLVSCRDNSRLEAKGADLDAFDRNQGTHPLEGSPVLPRSSGARSGSVAIPSVNFERSNPASSRRRRHRRPRESLRWIRRLRA